MPVLTRYDIQPGAAFHLGRRGIEQEATGLFIPADTLFAALLAAWAELGAAPEELARPFTGDGPAAPPFLLSSAFPRAGQLCFYPALPLNRLNLSEARLRRRLKELKAIKFVSPSIFERAINGQPLDDWLPPAGDEESQGLYLQGKDLWLSREELALLPEALRLEPSKPGRPARPRPPVAFRHLNIWQAAKVPRVTVDRLTNLSGIYHTGRLTFQPDCGFWFGLAWLQPNLFLAGGQTIRQAVELALSSLADIGLGGERSAGYGHFRWQEAGQVNWPDPQSSQPFVTLSRYHPRPAELPGCLQDRPVAYRLVSVGGWLQSPDSKAQRRRRLWLIEEGSIVRAIGAGPWGDVTDVKPNYDDPDFPPAAGDRQIQHPVWRYGLACPVAFGGVQ